MKNARCMIAALLCATLILPGDVSAGRKHAHAGSSISQDEILGLERSGALIRIGKDSWKTRGGLVIAGLDPDGNSRLAHIMRHAKDDPGRPHHGVFLLPKAKIIELMDEAWETVRSGGAEKSERGGRIAYTVRFHRAVGYLGGKDGRRRGYPRLYAVRLVVVKNEARVVTFFPL